MLNRAEIIGHLGNDPDVKYTQGGDTITSISVATTEKWKDKNGERQERTEWHRATFFGKLAEIAGQYLAKGKLVYIAGRIQTDKYTDKDGVERYSTKIIANEMKMLGGGEGGGQRGGQREERQETRGGDREGGGRSQGRSSSSGSTRRAPPPRNDDFSDDDIPF